MKSDFCQDCPDSGTHQTGSLLWVNCKFQQGWLNINSMCNRPATDPANLNYQSSLDGVKPEKTVDVKNQLPSVKASHFPNLAQNHSKDKINDGGEKQKMSKKLEKLEQGDSDLAAVWKIKARLLARRYTDSQTLSQVQKISRRQARRQLQEANAYFEALLPAILMQPEFKAVHQNDLTSKEEPSAEMTFKISLELVHQSALPFLDEIGALEKLFKTDGRK